MTGCFSSTNRSVKRSRFLKERERNGLMEDATVVPEKKFFEEGKVWLD